MVWCSSEHRRFMFVMLRAMWLNALRALHSTFSVCTQLRLGSTKFDASVLWNGYSRFPVLLLLLAHFAAGCGSLDTRYMYTHSFLRMWSWSLLPQPPPLPRDTHPNAHSLIRIPHMVHRESSRNRSDCTPTFHIARIKARLGHGSY